MGDKEKLYRIKDKLIESGYGKEKAWRNLFHKTNTGDIDNTSKDKTLKILRELFRKTEVFTNDYLKGLIDSFLLESEEKGVYEWSYYYIKHKSYRPRRFGKYNIDTSFINP